MVEWINLEKGDDVYTNSELADICDRAADEVMIRGGAVGWMKLSDGTVCVNGAIACAMGREGELRQISCDDEEVWWFMPTEDDVSEVAVGPQKLHNALKLFTNWQPVFRWNDDKTRTDDERIELLRRTAKHLREQQ